MKGIVFTEFMDMVDSAFGKQTCDALVDACALKSGGSYSAVGNYPQDELISLASELSRMTDHPLPGLLQRFGEHLFDRFGDLYPSFLADYKSALDFIPDVEKQLHVEVRALDPDAELPSFEHRWLEDGRLEITYESSRPFADFCAGLLQGCIRHFGDMISVKREALPSNGQYRERFLLTRII